MTPISVKNILDSISRSDRFILLGNWLVFPIWLLLTQQSLSLISKIDDTYDLSRNETFVLFGFLIFVVLFLLVLCIYLYDKNKNYWQDSKNKFGPITKLKDEDRLADICNEYPQLEAYRQEIFKQSRNVLIVDLVAMDLFVLEQRLSRLDHNFKIKQQQVAELFS